MGFTQNWCKTKHQTVPHDRGKDNIKEKVVKLTNPIYDNVFVICQGNIQTH